MAEKKYANIKTKAEEKPVINEKVKKTFEDNDEKAAKKPSINQTLKKNAQVIKSSVENGAEINVRNKKISISKNVIAVVIILIFIGAVLAAGYFITKGKITDHEKSVKNGALKEVFPEAISYTDASYNYNMLVSFLEDKGLEYTDVIIDKIMYARNEQNSVKGLIIYVECYKKFGGIIKIAVGIQNKGEINNYTVLDVSDAKGLDLRIKDESFKSQFIGKSVPFFVLAENPTEANEVSEITGASDASYAIVNGINASIYTLQFIDESMGGLLG